uniref:Uncharacterized protein n=1 Tax=Rhodococcus sp. NS1 TaxID=402236 RepID=A0A097SQD0_9NOCA|nr:hypothetical protein LRS1606.293 [Rhodococcus sp. NS1]
MHHADLTHRGRQKEDIHLRGMHDVRNMRVVAVDARCRMCGRGVTAADLGCPCPGAATAGRPRPAPLLAGPALIRVGDNPPLQGGAGDSVTSASYWTS